MAIKKVKKSISRRQKLSFKEASSGKMTSQKSNSSQRQCLQNLQLLNHYYPHVRCALNYETPYQLLVATVLSAQCTDERVNQVTPELFRQYPDPVAMSQARLDVVEKLIHSTGFYKNKSKNLVEAAKLLVQKHQGQVPQNLESLVQLPGVGRKTANVVLGNVWGIVSGIVVDTHVSRLTQRLGWTKEKTPEKIENDLMKIVPKDQWIQVSHLLIQHGRGPCKARSPDCSHCFLQESCPSAP
jgi:endonuclease-3